MKEIHKYIGIMEIGSSSIKSLYPIKDSEGASGLNLFRKGVIRLRTNKDVKILNLKIFEYDILPQIKKVFFALQKEVHTVHIITTGYWRDLENAHDIEIYIKQITNQPVHFLSTQEEGECSARSFLDTYTELEEIPDQNVSIDLGGSSTEITLFNKDIFETISLPIGTNRSLQAFYASKKTDVKGKLSEAQEIWRQELTKTLNQIPRDISENALGIATGSVIRKTITSLAGNPIDSLHGCKVPLSELRKFAVYYYEEAQKSLVEIDLEQNNNLRDLLFAAICLPVYLEILEHFNIKNVQLNAAGVSYGYFYKKINT